MRTFGIGKTILNQDEPNIGLICIVKGKVKSSIIFPDGTEKIIGLFDAPALFGEAACIDAGPNVCNVTTLTNVDAVCIRPLEVHKIIIKHPEIAETQKLLNKIDF
jgi:CRP-like cAMP-binding protein